MPLIFIGLWMLAILVAYAGLKAVWEILKTYFYVFRKVLRNYKNRHLGYYEYKAYTEGLKEIYWLLIYLAIVLIAFGLFMDLNLETMYIGEVCLR